MVLLQDCDLLDVGCRRIRRLHCMEDAATKESQILGEREGSARIDDGDDIAFMGLGASIPT